MISRSELAELFRQDDRHRAEWQAEREAQASPYVQRNDDAAGLNHRQCARVRSYAGVGCRL
jgi:hypothetical protein